MSREDARSPVWGGATMGFVVGLILGFFVGNYWWTVLYAVLVGAGVGVAANVLALLGRLVARRREEEYGELSDEERADRLREAEEWLRSYNFATPSDLESVADDLHECVSVVVSVEMDEVWRAGYESLESFYRAHEQQHPDIRAYTAVGYWDLFDQTPTAEGRGKVIAQRIAALRHSREPGE